MVGKEEKGKNILFANGFAKVVAAILRDVQRAYRLQLLLCRCNLRMGYSSFQIIYDHFRVAEWETVKTVVLSKVTCMRNLFVRKVL